MNLLIKTTATFLLAELLKVGWVNPGKKEVKYLSGTDNEIFISDYVNKTI